MGSWEKFFPRCFTVTAWQPMGEGVSLAQNDGFGKNMAVPPLPGLPEGAGDSEAPFWPGPASRTHTDELTLQPRPLALLPVAQHCPLTGTCPALQ